MTSIRVAVPISLAALPRLLAALARTTAALPPTRKARRRRAFRPH